MKYDVIIVGAGAAGLIAAYELTKAQKSVLVIEARDRIGGRIYTISEARFKGPIQAGAEFIHGEATLTVSLLKEAQMNYDEMTGEMYQLERGELVHHDFFGNEWQVMIDELNKVRYDKPFVEFLNQNFPKDEYPDFFESIRKFVEGYNAADMNDVSTLALKEEWTQEEDPKQYRPVGGYGLLVDYLHKSILDGNGLFALSHCVTDIILEKDQVVVKSDRLDFTATKVLITIPISMLQNESIHFQPAIPHYITAAKQFGFGSVIKFIFEFKDRFWESTASRKYEDMKFIFSDAIIPTWWSQLPEPTTILTGWLGGPTVRKINPDKTFLYEQALLSLSYLFNESTRKIEDQIQSWHIENWLTDPFALGAYSYPKIDTEHAKTLLNTPISDQLFFAGEALFSGPATGTVEAAFASGKDAAKRILKLLAR